MLSQRLCLEPAFGSSEAIQLAERSVANHMRLLTGVSDCKDILYTSSPSEPILALASASILNSCGENRWPETLNTLSKDLCSAGLVEKGLLGELNARILLIVARDFAAPRTDGDGRRDLLQPVRLLDFLDVLFGNSQWAGTARPAFEEAFLDAWLNFTHWAVTKDPLPEVPNP